MLDAKTILSLFKDLNAELATKGVPPLYATSPALTIMGG